MATGVQGLDEVLGNLNKEIEGIQERGSDGLWDAGLQLQRVSQKELQASVISGNLRASAYTRKAGQFMRLDDNRLDRKQSAPDPSGSVKGDGVEVGYTALYALFAHENMEGRAPKYLEGPMRRNQKALLEVIRKRAEIRK